MPVVGVTMVERLVNTFVEVLPRPLTEAVFVLGDFPTEVNDALSGICDRNNMKATFVYQDKALGTGHAVHCAAEHLEGEVVVVFADTLFVMDRPASLDEADVVAWVKHVDDPSRFGVAVRDGGRITGFVEKPTELISNEALIGIYYVRDGAQLRSAIRRLIDEHITGHGGEYQLTDAFDILLKQDLVFKTEGVTDWLDCGTIEAFMETSRFILTREAETRGEVIDSELIQPVFVAEGATISNSTVGPNVVLEEGSSIRESTVRESILFSGARVDDSDLVDSMVGRHATIYSATGRLNVGDHSSFG